MNIPPPLPVAPPPLPAPAPDWRRAFGGVWRLTYPRFLSPTALAILAGLLAVLALLTVVTVRNGNAAHFLDWGVHFYLAFALPVVAFLAAGGQIQDDMKPATVDYVLTRPVRRATFIIQRYLSHTLCLQAQCLFALAAMALAGAFREVPGLMAILPSMLVAQFFAVIAFGALGFAFGALTHRYLILGIVYAAVIESGIGNIPTQISRLSMTFHLRAIAKPPIEVDAVASASGMFLFGSVAMLVGFSVVCIGVAAALFSLRDSAGARPKDA